MRLQSVLSDPETRTAYIYAETAFHHEGELGRLEDLVDASAQSGAHGIKFQVLLNPDSAYSSDLPHIDRIRSWCFKRDEWLQVFDRAARSGLEVIAMPIDMDSVDFVIENRPLFAALEVHSICFNEVPMLQAIAETDVPVFFNIGGRTVDEIDFALSHVLRSDSALVYGLQNFPTDPSTINLARVPRYAARFGHCMGYADHTTGLSPEAGTQLSCIAYSLGCRIFERHITTERESKRVDHEAAVLPDDIRTMIAALDQTAASLGEGSVEHLSDRDASYRRRQKQIVFSRDLETGARLGPDDLTFMVTPKAGDFDQIAYMKLLGTRLRQPVKGLSPVRRDDVDITD